MISMMIVNDEPVKKLRRVSNSRTRDTTSPTCHLAKYLTGNAVTRANNRLDNATSIFVVILANKYVRSAPIQLENSDDKNIPAKNVVNASETRCDKTLSMMFIVKNGPAKPSNNIKNDKPKTLRRNGKYFETTGKNQRKLNCWNF